MTADEEREELEASQESDDEQDAASVATAEQAGQEAASEEGEEEKPEKLNLEVGIDSPSACERHVIVTIPPEDIQRYFENAISKMMPEANVPGFRPGRAPRKLVAQKFRREVSDQIKGELLMDSISQITEEQDLTAISEPEFDLDAVEVPEDGPMTFEFDLEVRPEFDVPEWKGLEIERPVKEITDPDVQNRLESVLSKYGKLVPHDGPASKGDYLTLNINCKHNGRQTAAAREEVVRVQPVLSFHDAEIQDFDELMAGVSAGDKRETEAELSPDAANIELRGEPVRIEFEVLDVKKLQLPELTSDFVRELGEFESEQELREAIREDLERQLEYHQHQQVRQQISEALVESADWELPPKLLRRQSRREVERAVLEMQRAGFSEAQIRARENRLRQTSAASTARALKEHFILERIAEEESIDVDPADYDVEVGLIAKQTGENPRRVRAQIEKRGLMDSLRNQILERKVIEAVEQEARFKDVPFSAKGEDDVEAIDMAAGGGPRGGDIPDISESGKEAEETTE